VAATFEEIMMIRKAFRDDIDETESALNKMLEDMQKLHAIVTKKVNQFNKTDNLAHIVGEKLTSIHRPVKKLQRLRKSIYPNAELVSYYKTEIFPKAHEISADAKSLMSQKWTEICGSETTIKILTTNADKEREASFLLNSCKVKNDKLQSVYSVMKNLFEFVSDNLDALNKTESALRLEYNMSNAVWGVGDDKGENLGTDEGTNVIAGYDPLVDDNFDDLEDDLDSITERESEGEPETDPVNLEESDSSNEDEAVDLDDGDLPSYKEKHTKNELPSDLEIDEL